MENFGRADSFAGARTSVPDCIIIARVCYAHYIYAYAKSLPCDKVISLKGNVVNLSTEHICLHQKASPAIRGGVSDS